MRKFDLNVEQVLEDWEPCHAIREIISNAIDEQSLTKTEGIQIFKEEAAWHIRDFGRGLEYKHLTQNESAEKLKNPNSVIGKFGVGLKDALATFDRKRIDVLIKSMHGDITIEQSTKHQFDNVVTLHAVIHPPSNSMLVGTEFIVKNVSDESIEKAKSFFLIFSNEQVLEKTTYGEVLQGQFIPRRIYVNGLRIAEEDNFLFSYNITSLTKIMRTALNRERTNVGRMAYTPRVKSILRSCQSFTVAQSLMQDLQQYAQGDLHDELKWTEIAAHASRILNSSGKVVFMTPDQLVSHKSVVDGAERDGYQVVAVPENVRHKISGTRDLSGNQVRDVTQFIREQRDSFQFVFIEPDQLTPQEAKVFSKTEAIIKLAGGRPFSLKKIRISETMRPGEYGYETSGLWEPTTGSIIIKRSQLARLEWYAGILLHELTYIKSGADIVSSEFEEALTTLLGTIAASAVRLSAKVKQSDTSSSSSLPLSSLSSSSSSTVSLRNPESRLLTSIAAETASEDNDSKSEDSSWRNRLTAALVQQQPNLFNLSLPSSSLSNKRSGMIVVSDNSDSDDENSVSQEDNSKSEINFLKATKVSVPSSLNFYSTFQKPKKRKTDYCLDEDAIAHKRRRITHGKDKKKAHANSSVGIHANTNATSDNQNLTPCVETLDDQLYSHPPCSYVVHPSTGDDELISIPNPTDISLEISHTVWLHIKNSLVDSTIDHGAGRVGKWMLFVSRDDVNEKWNVVKNLIRNGKLWDAKVSTRQKGKAGHVIIIYTKDYKDIQDVYNVHCVLEQFGLKRNKDIYYKTNIQTAMGIYSGSQQRPWIYSSSTILQKILEEQALQANTLTS